jgi:hypothetical protein
MNRLEYSRDLPQRISCDNGSEFAGGQMDLWAYNHKVQMDFNRRGKPTDNAMVESFNGKFREECLNAHWFESIEDAKQKIDAWRWDYNEHRPHRSLEGLTPGNLRRVRRGRRLTLRMVRISQAGQGPLSQSINWIENRPAGHSNHRANLKTQGCLRAGVNRQRGRREFAHKHIGRGYHCRCFRCQRCAT